MGRSEKLFEIISILVFLDFNKRGFQRYDVTDILFQSLFSWILTRRKEKRRIEISATISILVFLDFNIRYYLK